MRYDECGEREGGIREGETKVVSWEVELDEIRRMW